MFYFPNSSYQQNYTQYQQNNFTQNQQPQTMLLHVPTSKDFDSVAIQPGKSALILAQNEPYMVLKSADGMGAISSTYYKYEAVDGKDSVMVFGVIDDLMDTLQSTAPRVYYSVMQKVREIE